MIRKDLQDRSTSLEVFSFGIWLRYVNVVDRFIYYMHVYNTMQAQRMIHYPRLDTVLMVEEAIKEAKEYPSKRQLWLSLKRKVMYQTFNVIISYLEESGKIIQKNGKIIWIWNPELVKKYSNSNLVLK